MKKHIAAALFALIAGNAAAESASGIEVYPGAKEDKALAQQLKQTMNLNAKTYRTSDPVPKVTEFYRKQKLKEEVGTSDKGSLHRKERLPHRPESVGGHEDGQAQQRHAHLDRPDGALIGRKGDRLC